MEPIRINTLGQQTKSLDYYAHCFVVRYVDKRLLLNAESYIVTLHTHCPFCITEDKTNAHFLDCPGNQTPWKEVISMPQPIYHAHHIDPIIHILISSSLQKQDFKATMELHLCIDWIPYWDIIHMQSYIGWDQIQYGQFTSAWDEIQYRYLKNTQQQPPKEETQWLRKIIYTMWEHTQARWNNRNNILHPNE
eukprot:8700261-Ditylum_brightwellii.AAC.1